jgi:hypothetical protein
MKSLDTIKDWTLKAVVPETKTATVSWMPGDILSNVKMEMRELVGGEPTGPVIDMKTQGLITIDGGEDGTCVLRHRPDSAGRAGHQRLG